MFFGRFLCICRNFVCHCGGFESLCGDFVCHCEDFESLVEVFCGGFYVFVEILCVIVEVYFVYLLNFL